MNTILNFIYQFFKLFKWWIIVNPWEQCVRVRFGKKVKLLMGGIHLKIPYFDSCYLHCTRMRASSLGKQTITTLDGKVVTIQSNLSYEITDALKLQNTLFAAEDTVRNYSKNEISRYISSHDLKDCLENKIKSGIKIDLTNYGIKVIDLCISEFAYAKTFRLIGDQQDWSTGNVLTTVNKHDD